MAGGANRSITTWARSTRSRRAATIGLALTLAACFVPGPGAAQTLSAADAADIARVEAHINALTT